MRHVLSIDFETRSPLDLRKTGMYRYVEHEHTDIWMFAWAFDDEEPAIWLPHQSLPERVREHVASGGEIRAWNAQFERVIWRGVCVPKYGFPPARLEQFWCTAADAAAMSLPRSLDHAAAVMEISELKDKQGSALAKRMARPRKIVTVDGEEVYTWWNEPDKLQRLAEYCLQDVRTERALYHATRRLDPREREIYLLDQIVNERGIGVDREFIEGARRIVERGLEEANHEISDLTSGQVGGVTKIADMKRWMGSQGVDVPSVTKDAVRDLLSGDLPCPVRRVLEIRASAGRSSVVKLDTALASVSKGNRIRGSMLHLGANTGRWSGRGVQPHNLPRGEIAGADALLPAVTAGDYDAVAAVHPPIEVVSSLLRGMFRAAPGNTLWVSDFSQIEARILAWIAGQEDLVSLFASDGKVYESMAAARFKVPVEEITKDDPRRQLGKIAVLGCGFQMGPDRLQDTAARDYGLTLSKEEAVSAVQAYREAYPKIVEYWWGVEKSALKAVRAPGDTVRHRGCTFLCRGEFLYLVLPSRRVLMYPFPTIEKRRAPWGMELDRVMTYHVNPVTRKWQRRSMYGGAWTENIVQAIARDFMAEAMLRLDSAGYKVVLTVHDEIVTERRKGEGSMEEFERLMTQRPAWAATCPIKVESWSEERYRK